MVEWEKEFKDIRIDPDQWKNITQDPNVEGIRYQAQKEPYSKLVIQKPDDEWVEVDYFKDAIITLDNNKIIYNPNDVLDGKKLE